MTHEIGSILPLIFGKMQKLKQVIIFIPQLESISLHHNTHCCRVTAYSPEPGTVSW